MDKLKKEVILQTVIFLLFLGLLIFLPAWTIYYWEAWVYWFIFSVAIIIIDIYFFKKDPELIKRRLKLSKEGEKETTQKILQSIAGTSYFCMFIFLGFDHHYSWSNVPAYLVVTADLFALAGFYIIFLVFKENSYTSSIIEVEKEQKVITTGPYRIVRHPMYSGGLLYLLCSPIALGSYWALLFFMPLFIVIVLRLLDEEKYLKLKLPEYNQYCQETRFRLIPLIW